MTSETVCPTHLNQLLMIEYPGFVKNVDKALDTLGGLTNIERVVASQKDRLELKFRISDPLAHAAHGDRGPRKCLVLRIKKSKNDLFNINVVGKIQTAYRFDTLAEFQWLPMQRTNMTEQGIKSSELYDGVTIKRTPESLEPKYASVLDDTLPIKNPFDNTLKNFNPDAPLLVLPAIFSRFDTAKEIHQPHPKFRSKEMREEFERKQNLSIIGRTRKKRTTMSYLINFGDPIPAKPSEKLEKERSILTAQDHSILPELIRCFDKQKVWSKAALCYELNCTVLDVKYTLPLVAYYCLNGPFRTMWIKYGYDALKDSSSKRLQTLDFRVRGPQGQQEYSRRSTNQYQLPMRKNAEKAKNTHQVDLKTAISNASAYNTLDENLEDSMVNLKNMAITEAMCKFRRNLIPPTRQISYQLKDIEIDEVQAILHSNDGREPEVCSEKDGWLPEGSIDRIRKEMNKVLHETYELMTDRLLDQPTDD